ncbi:unnamed protein product [Linum trigynum]|uniref:Uncharacterized protein n=1 Tax=Linum trigynum TaxID=586398 RepID=A0AAV2DEF7_9ROSI
MGRQPCCDKLGVKKGPWTADEDRKLVNFIVTQGQCCWRAVPKLAGLRRCGKSCRLRWTNYLRPDLKRGLLNDAEEQLVIQLHSRLGNRWSKIAAELPGRTDNEIKNHWNTHIKKKLIKMGIDPITHRPLDDQEKQSSGVTESENSALLPKGSHCSSENGSIDDDESRPLDPNQTSEQLLGWSSAPLDEVEFPNHIESTWNSCLTTAVTAAVGSGCRGEGYSDRVMLEPEPDWGWPAGMEFKMKDSIGDELGFLNGFSFSEMDLSLTELGEIS